MPKDISQVIATKIAQRDDGTVRAGSFEKFMDEAVPFADPRYKRGILSFNDPEAKLYEKVVTAYQQLDADDQKDLNFQYKNFVEQVKTHGGYDSETLKNIDDAAASVGEAARLKAKEAEDRAAQGSMKEASEYLRSNEEGKDFARSGDDRLSSHVNHIPESHRAEFFQNHQSEILAHLQSSKNPNAIKTFDKLKGLGCPEVFKIDDQEILLQNEAVVATLKHGEDRSGPYAIREAALERRQQMLMNREPDPVRGRWSEVIVANAMDHHSDKKFLGKLVQGHISHHNLPELVNAAQQVDGKGVESLAVAINRCPHLSGRDIDEKWKSSLSDIVQVLDNKLQEEQTPSRTATGAVKGLAHKFLGQEKSAILTADRDISFKVALPEEGKLPNGLAPHAAEQVLKIKKTYEAIQNSYQNSQTPHEDRAMAKVLKRSPVER